MGVRQHSQFICSQFATMPKNEYRLLFDEAMYLCRIRCGNDTRAVALLSMDEYPGRLCGISVGIAERFC